MNDRNYFREIKKHSILKKNSSLRLNTVNHNKKIFFRKNYFGSQFFFMSCHYTKAFVHRLIIAAVNNFNVLKLTGWYPENIYLFKISSRNTTKKCEICSKLTIKTVERRSGVFIATFEHILHLFLVLLLFSMNREMFVGQFFFV